MKPFIVMAKPVGSICNMRCSYCYYLGKDETVSGCETAAMLYNKDNAADAAAGSGSTKNTRTANKNIMTDAVLTELIRQVILSSEGPAVHFYWHGGEPTLAGVKFFEKAVRTELKALPPGWMVTNNLQTNGLNLTEEFCAFLARYRFEVGISIDGTESCHDANRRSISGGRTWETVKNNIRRLISFGIEPDILCTVNSVTVKQPEDVYRELASLGSSWIQFIPVVVRDQAGKILPLSVEPEEYGDFLCRVFDQWHRSDMGRVDIQIIAELAGMMTGREAAVCWMSRECGNVLVVEKDGSVYSCDHFVDWNHYLGNLMGNLKDNPKNNPEDNPKNNPEDTPFDNLRGNLVKGTVESPAKNRLSVFAGSEFQRRFGEAKHEHLTKQCRECHWLAYCGGGCLKDRFGISEDGEEGHYYLCAGMKKFFSYAVPELKKLI